MPATAREVLDFWFGDAAAGDDKAIQEAFSRWFKSDAEFDAEIERRFGALIENALAGGLREWENEIHSRLALILLLDQFPRNVFRRTARAFAGDSRALGLAVEAVREGQDRNLQPVEKVFLLMPYQHAEQHSVQDESVRLFRELAEASAPGAVRKFLQSSLEYAEKHREIVARFGRFPYRNDVLGRTSTEAEEHWLQETEQRFGQ